jgi:molecular chaperone DnaK
MGKYCSNCGNKISFLEALRSDDNICNHCKKSTITKDQQEITVKGSERESITPTKKDKLSIATGKEKVIGIDFGTSNSQAAVLIGDQFTIIPSIEGVTNSGKMFPSIVTFTKDGQMLVGESAHRQTISNPEGTILSVKWKLGTNIKFEINGEEYIPQQIIAFILQKIKHDSEVFIGEPVKKAVIAVPVYFNDFQRSAMKDAGTIAGLEVIQLVNESTAAAMAHSLYEGTDQTILVFDLGAEKLDITIMTIGDKIFQVLTKFWDTKIGGEFMDNAILNWLFEDIKEKEGIDLLTDKNMTQWAREEVERAKIDLSTVLETHINLSNIVTHKDISRKLTRRKVEQLVKPIITRCIHSLYQAHEDAHIAKKDINKVILVGGPTHMPIIREAISNYFGADKIVQRVDPCEYVAIGAAIQGSILTNEISDRILLDVSSLTVGIVTHGGKLEPIIKRNTNIPISQNKIFSTSSDSQTMLTICVFQGENVLVKDNFLLGEFQIVGIPPAPRGIPQISMIFEIGSNGILKVSAKDLGFGKDLLVNKIGNMGLSKEEITQMMYEMTLYEETIQVDVNSSQVKKEQIEKSKKFSLESERLDQHFSKQECLFKTKGYENALQSLDEKIEVNPNSADLWFLKGALLLNFGEYEKALPNLNKALDINPNFTPAWCDKGITLYFLNLYEEAIKALDKALEMIPLNPLTEIATKYRESAEKYRELAVNKIKNIGLSALSDLNNLEQFLIDILQ